MPKEVNRGFVPTDAKEFGANALPNLQYAQQDIAYLLSRGYDLEHTVTFVGNRFQFSARQRTALTRSTAASEVAEKRRQKMKAGSLQDQTVYIDGFNLIITLEAAQSPETTLLRCTDGTLRDLCGLHGTYRIIEATGTALGWIGKALKKKQLESVVWYLDAPVSNSGRLRAAILEEMERCAIPAVAELVPNADALLWDKENAVTSDAIILDRCTSWVNLAREIIEQELPDRRMVDLSGGIYE